MRISVELVPREAEALLAELHLIKEHFAVVNTINIPDVLRFPMRSWEGCGIAAPLFGQAIPHIRAMDIDPDRLLPMLETIERHRLKEVLVVTGDVPQQMDKPMYPSTSIDIIKRFKKELPGVKVYAAIDPYRSSLKEEAAYIRRKREAGADGFFTQPFFDLRLMEVYADLLQGVDVFWGVSPVVSDKSRNYWEVKNHAVFPSHFEPKLEWNIDFARKVVDFAAGTGSHMYLMPIRIDLHAYLKGIFG